MKAEDDPEFMESVEECILDLSPAELNFYETVSKELGVDPAVEALRPSYARYLEEEGISPERDEVEGSG
jgi:hypothetical protein